MSSRCGRFVGEQQQGRRRIVGYYDVESSGVNHRVKRQRSPLPSTVIRRYGTYSDCQVENWESNVRLQDVAPLNFDNDWDTTRGSVGQRAFWWGPRVRPRHDPLHPQRG
jgi:hypothetical protein